LADFFYPFIPNKSTENPSDYKATQLLSENGLKNKNLKLMTKK
jgi:hypothetical protein